MNYEDSNILLSVILVFVLATGIYISGYIIFGKDATQEHMCIHTIDGTCEICGRVNSRIRASYNLNKL